MTSLKDFSLEGKNAWITGASYGIGFNIASAFAAAGIKTIVFNDIKQELVDRGLAAYKEAGIENVKGYVCDVTNEEQVAELVKTIHEEVGQIDILVNNAGIIKRIQTTLSSCICRNSLTTKLTHHRADVDNLTLTTLHHLRDNSA